MDWILDDILRGHPLLFVSYLVESSYMKRTYQPKKRKRSTTHGFLRRMASRTGRAVIRRRRQKGRSTLAVQGRRK